MAPSAVGESQSRLRADKHAGGSIAVNEASNRQWEHEGASGVMEPAHQGLRRDNAHRMFAVRGMLAFGLALALLAGSASAIHAAFCVDPALKPTAVEARIVERIASEEVPNDAEKTRQVYVWFAVRNESGIKMRGAVPSEEDLETVLGMVKAHFPDLSVKEKLKVVEGGLQHEQWLGAVSFGLKQLSHLKQGKVRLVAANLHVAGEAASAEDYAEIKRALAGSLPDGLTIKSDEVRPPVADPFEFTADLGVNALSLAGSVPSEDARKQLRDLSRQLFARPGLDDRLEVASGAPKNWDEAVTAALRALSRLETGKVALSGIAVSIEGVAPDQGTAVAVSYQLRRDLPKIFSTSESIKWKEANVSPNMAAQVIPRIKAFAQTKGGWLNGELPPLTPLRDQRSP